MQCSLLLQEDDNHNFTAIWVFTPTGDKVDFKV